MRARFMLAAAGAALLFAAPHAHAARADFVVRTAGELANLCAERPAGPRQDGAIDFCHGYAQGVVSLELDHGRAFCIPTPSPSRNATLAEFVTWARATPQRLSQPAAKTLIGFFKERFPCTGG